MIQDSLVTVSPLATIKELESLLVENGISGAPVVNREGDLIGVVSQTDVLRFIHRGAREADFYNDTSDVKKLDRDSLDEKLLSTRVNDIMQTHLRFVSPQDDLATVAKILRKNRIHRLLVVDDSKLVGLITTFDLIRLLEDPEMVKEFWGHPLGYRFRHYSPFKSRS